MTKTRGSDGKQSYHVCFEVFVLLCLILENVISVSAEKPIRIPSKCFGYSAKPAMRGTMLQKTVLDLMRILQKV